MRYALCTDDAKCYQILDKHDLWFPGEREKLEKWEMIEPRDPKLKICKAHVHGYPPKLLNTHPLKYKDEEGFFVYQCSKGGE